MAGQTIWQARIQDLRPISSVTTLSSGEDSPLQELPTLRRKARHSRIRTGYLTCKKRRLKCDEGKPLCFRCRRSHLMCAGYQTIEPLIFDYHASIEERRRTQYFLERTVPSIEVCNDADREFWTTTVLQASHSESFLRAALLSISAYHESLTDHAHRFNHQRSAQALYVKALILTRTLPQPSDAIEKGTLLMMSILLRSVEVFRNDFQAAAVHLNASRSLLQEIRTASKESMLVQQILHPMLQRLEYQSLPTVVIREGDLPTSSAFNKTRRTHAERIRDRGNAAMSWVCHNLATTRLSPVDFDKFRCHAYFTLQRFYVDLQAALWKDETRMSCQYMLYFKIQWLLVKVALTTLIHEDELITDKSVTDFRALLDLCESWNSHDRSWSQQQQKPADTPPTVQLSIGIELVSTVFLVATKCRDPRIRRRAVRFLRGSPRREQKWWSLHAARMAEWLIGREELHRPPNCASDVPLSHRIHIRQVEYFHDSQQDDLPPSDPTWSFRTPSWARISYTLANNRSTRFSQWIQLSHKQQPLSEHEQLPKPGSENHLKLYFEIIDPIFPSTAAVLAIAYKIGQGKDAADEKSGMLVCDATSSHTSTERLHGSEDTQSTEKRCVLCWETQPSDHEKTPTLCSMRCVDPDRLAL